MSWKEQCISNVCSCWSRCGGRLFSFFLQTNLQTAVQQPAPQEAVKWINNDLLYKALWTECGAVTRGRLTRNFDLPSSGFTTAPEVGRKEGEFPLEQSQEQEPKDHTGTWPRGLAGRLEPGGLGFSLTYLTYMYNLQKGYIYNFKTAIYNFFGRANQIHTEIGVIDLSFSLKASLRGGRSVLCAQFLCFPFLKLHYAEIAPPFPGC